MEQHQVDQLIAMMKRLETLLAAILRELTRPGHGT